MSLNLNVFHLPLAITNNFSYLPPHDKKIPRSCSSIISSFNKTTPSLLSNVVSLGVVVGLISFSPSPALGFPSLIPQPPAPALNATPFSQSKDLPTGLQNGKIRPCPSVNPSCVSTNPNSSSFLFPWTIPRNSVQNAIKDLEDAILETQKNVKIQVMDDTPNGKYLQAEVDGGGFGRDVMEFLVKEDTVVYRAMATKVTYIYPFTTAFGDSKGQEERLQKIVERLGWYTATLDEME